MFFARSFYPSIVKLSLFAVCFCLASCQQPESVGTPANQTPANQSASDSKAEGRSADPETVSSNQITRNSDSASKTQVTGTGDQADAAKTPRRSELNPPSAKAPESSQNSDAGSPSKFSATFFSWNVESEGNDPQLIAEQLAEFNHFDILGLTEVLPENFSRYRDALGQRFRYAYSRSGFSDRMMILYNTDRFEEIRSFELDEINFEMRYRSPLVVHLKDKACGVEFMVMVNHLARGKAEIRQQQAQQLVDWARDQRLPLVALGDYNFDFEFGADTGNEAFRVFLRDNIWRWVRPEKLIDTNWFDPEPDGKDNYPDSMLDFAFVAGPAVEWKATCEVIVREGDFPDGPRQSDHRPYQLRLQQR